MAIAAGSGHSLALKSDGTLVAWGVGAGTNIPAGLSNVMAIAAANSSEANQSAAAMSVPRCSPMARLSRGVPAFTTKPTCRAGLSNVVAVADSSYVSLALVNDGTPQILRQPAGGIGLVGTRLDIAGRGRGRRAVELPMAAQQHEYGRRDQRKSGAACHSSRQRRKLSGRRQQFARHGNEPCRADYGDGQRAVFPDATGNKSFRLSRKQGRPFNRRRRFGTAALSMAVEQQQPPRRDKRHPEF